MSLTCGPSATVEPLVKPHHTMWAGHFNQWRYPFCLSVRLSPIIHMWVRLVRKLPNQSTWNFRTTLRPWNLITWCITMTSLQIQDGGRPQYENRYIGICPTVNNDPIMTKCGTLKSDENDPQLFFSLLIAFILQLIQDMPLCSFHST